MGVVLFDEIPDAVVPADDAVDTLVDPLAALVPGADEHEVAADDVCAYGVDVLVGGDDVAPGLAHLLPVADDDALVVEPDEGLIEVEEADVPKGLDEEAGVEEVHYGVLCAAGVLVDGEPVLDVLGGEGGVTGVGRGVLEEVPGGAHEGVHGVGLPTGGAFTAGTGSVHEGLVEGEGRFAGGPELGVFGEEDGELGLGDGDNAA